jgi:diacylglycerol kinase family enzyme
VVRDAKRRKKRFLGVLAYLLGGWRMVMDGQARYTVSIDGVTLRRRAKTVLVANLGRLPAGAVLVPDTNAEDGLLEVAIIRAWSVPQMLRVVARALAGRPGNDDLIEVHRGQHITVRCSRPRPLHLDGEDAGSTTLLEAHVDPGALRVALPPASGGPSAASPTFGSLRSLRATTLSWLPFREKRHRRRVLARA